jgi:hypothetical protein
MSDNVINWSIVLCLNLTNSMEEGPSWEPSSYSADQEIPCLLSNLKVHYCVHKSTIVPYPKPIESSSHSHTLFLYDPF